MRRSVSFDYLELFCYGVPAEKIAARYGVTTLHVNLKLLQTARKVARHGFWKWHVPTLDMAYLYRRELLEKLREAFPADYRRAAA